MKLNRHSEALQLCQREKRMADLDGKPSRAAMVLRDITVINIILGEWKAAVEAATEAEAQYQKALTEGTNEDGELGEFLTSTLAAALRYDGQNEAAIAAYYRGKEACLRTGQTVEAANFILTTLDLLREIGGREADITLGRREIKDLLEPLTDNGLAKFVLGNTYMQIALDPAVSPAIAGPNFKAAAKSYEVINQTYPAALGYAGHAKWCASESKWKQVIQSGEKARLYFLQFAEDISTPAGKAKKQLTDAQWAARVDRPQIVNEIKEMLRLMGMAYRHQGKMKWSIGCFKEAEELV